MKIAVVGTGYVGLVTGVCLSEIGHHVTCIDVNLEKVKMMQSGRSPIYEPGLEELMVSNIEDKRLFFTNNYKEALEDAKAIYIAVGTPQNTDGTANLSYIEEVTIKIAECIEDYVVIITKSTVPVGTNEYIKQKIAEITGNYNFDIVSNPEFLREGSAINDSFHGDRIVIGAENEKASALVENINMPFGIPIFKTDIRSAELIKYASNAFLATKISFINEISALCEKLDADVEDVAQGMGLDKRIGKQFLRAGIGYGGSCFPKDTKALVQIAGNLEHEFDLLKSVININNRQQQLLVDKAKERLGSIKNLTFGILGLAFKPNTDDMREAASITVTSHLIEAGAKVKVYDPVAMDNAKSYLDKKVEFASSIEEVAKQADALFILTDWDEFKNMDLLSIINLMRNPIVFDGRNCFEIEELKEMNMEYYSIGRRSVKKIESMSRI